MWICTNMQKISLLDLFIHQIKSILESCHITGNIYFWPCQPLKFSITFQFAWICNSMKSSWVEIYKVNFRVQRPDWPYPFLTMPNQKMFNQLLIFANLYQHAKNNIASLICSGKTVHLNIIQSDWLRAFWPISQE